MYRQLARKRKSYIYILHFFLIKSWRFSFSKRFKTITECWKQVTRLIIPEYFSLASQTFFVVCDAAEKP